MNNKIARLVALAVFTVGVASATEMRSPYLSEKGPVRYTFEKEDPERYSLSIYSGVYGKWAHKAFLKHGTDAHELTALFFNKDEIPLVEIFPNSSMPLDSENYDPFIKNGSITPRVTYYETGCNLGGRFEYPIYKDKGRIGLRANIPFKTIEIERENFFDKYEEPLNDFKIEKVITINQAEGGPKNINTVVQSYRFDLVNSAWYLDAATMERKAAVQYGAKDVKIFGQPVAYDMNANDKKIKSNKVAVGVIAADAGKVPIHDPGKQLLGFDATNDVVAAAVVAGTNNYETKKIDENGAFANMGDYAYPNGVFDGIGLFIKKDFDGGDGPNYGTGGLGTGSDAAKANMEKMWLVFGYKDGVPQEAAPHIIKGMDDWLRQFPDNPYEWFARRDFLFETDRRQGLGDIDLDLFYEHTFCDDWVGEAMLGVRFPTGAPDVYTHNPFKPHLGNGEHWEIKLGGMIAWMPLDWMNVKLDGRFAFVLEATEQRAAGFKGAQIKNIGPAVAADVDWQYFVGTIDFTLFHPKTDDLSTVIGYEFYYKTRDDITQKKQQMESWLGKKWAISQAGPPVVYDWMPNEFDLDNGVLETNTQAIGHKFRCETSYRFSDWFEMYGGGSYVFAGKNIPRESDLHGGCNVRF